MDNTLKKPRALPRVWAPFYRLNVGDTFELTPGVSAEKRGLFWFVSFKDGLMHFVNPFRRFRTTTLVRDVLKGGKVGTGIVTPAVQKSYANPTIYQAPPADVVFPNPTAALAGRQAGSSITNPDGTWKKGLGDCVAFVGEEGTRVSNVHNHAAPHLG